MNLSLKSIIKVSVTGALMAQLIACGAVSSEIHNSKLNAESKMSNSIFLDPVDASQQTIYVQVKNSSTESLTSLSSQIKQNLQNGGWTIVTDPKKAHDMVQVNVLQFGAAKSPGDVAKATSDGFGSVMTGALAGVAVGYLAGSTAWGVGVGVGVAAASWLADEMVTNKTYSIITDVQVSVRNPDKSWKKQKTRIASMANQVNLKFEDAKPVIIAQQAKEVAGIFVTTD